jgi:hypothetical protein
MRKNASLAILATKVINGIERGNPKMAVKTPLFCNPLEIAVVKVKRIENEILLKIMAPRNKVRFSIGDPNQMLNVPNTSKLSTIEYTMPYKILPIIKYSGLISV